MHKKKHIEVIGHLLTWYGRDLLFFQKFRDFQRGFETDEAYCSYYPGSFQHFLNTYQVSRTFTKGQTNGLFQICLQYAQKPNLVDVDVNQLAEKIHEAGISTGLPVSLASKVLFLMKPEIILPSDRRAKRALGLGVSDTDYSEYLRRAMQYENQVVVQLDKILEPISHMLDILEQGYEHLEVPFNQLRKKRLLDKMLWVEGGG